MMPTPARRWLTMAVGSATLLIALCAAPAGAQAATLDPFCDALASSVDRDPDLVIELIDNARAAAQAQLDAGAEKTPELLAELDKCADLRLTALTQKEADAASDRREKTEKAAHPTQAEVIDKQLSAVMERWLTPLSGIGLLTGALFIAYLVLARFFSLTPIARRGIYNRYDRPFAAVLGVAGSAVAAAGLSLAIVRVNRTENLQPAQWAELGLWVLASAAGIYVTARWIASRLKLAVDVFDVTGARSDWGTARVVNLLSTLAGSPARGVEVPIGSDVDALVGAALPETGASAILSRVQAAIRFVFLGTPWKIVVRIKSDDLEADDATQATVTVQQNGESVDQLLVDLDRFRLPSSARKIEALYVFVASAIIIALSKRNTGFQGLAGTTSWRSLGLQALGTTAVTSDADKSTLLRKAVEADDENLIAHFALNNIAFGNAFEPDELSTYADTLQRELEQVRRLPRTIKRPLDLELRIRLVLAIVALNRAAAENPTTLTDRDRSNLNALIWMLSPRWMNSPLQRTIRSEASIAVKTARELSTPGRAPLRLANWLSDRWFRSAEESLEPYLNYSLACHYARVSVGADTRPDPDVRRKNADIAVKKHLKIAVTHDTLRDLAPSDPELAEWQAAHRDDFRDIVTLTPPVDFWTIDAFAALKSQLVKAGVTGPGRLHEYPTPADLRVYLKLQEPEFARLESLSRLVAAADAAALKSRHENLTLELINAIIAANHEQPSDIPVEWTTAKGLATEKSFFETVSEIAKKYNQRITRAELAQWLAAIRKWKPAPR